MAAVVLMGTGMVSDPPEQPVQDKWIHVKVVLVFFFFKRRRRERTGA